MKYWLIAVSSAVNTSFSTSITAGSPRIAGPPGCVRRKVSAIAGRTQRIENGCHEARERGWEELARGGDGQLGAIGRAARRFVLDQLAHGRDASAAAAPRMAREGDLARRMRAAPD